MKTTNKIQEQYIQAKAYFKTLEDKKNKQERQYIFDNNIINPDGTIPNYIYCIEDESIFNKANEEQAEIFEASALRKDMLEAEEALSRAEFELIEYGLSLVPGKEREILKIEAKKNYTARLKIIDMILNLDVSSVR